MNRKQLKKLVSVTEQKADKPICDATRQLGDAEAFTSACHELESLCLKLGAYDLILSPDGLGLVFGAAVAAQHEHGFVAAMRMEKQVSDPDSPGVRPHEVRCLRDKSKVDLLVVQAGVIKPDQRVIIIDDILASGATTLGLAYTVEELGGQVVGIATLAELTMRCGRLALEARGYQVRSVLRL